MQKRQMISNKQKWEDGDSMHTVNINLNFVVQPNKTPILESSNRNLGSTINCFAPTVNVTPILSPANWKLKSPINLNFNASRIENSSKQSNYTSNNPQRLLSTNAWIPPSKRKLFSGLNSPLDWASPNQTGIMMPPSPGITGMQVKFPIKKKPIHLKPLA